MASTILLDSGTWDLVLDSAGNIAVASEPYSLAQDAASAIKTFKGEIYWDTTIGVPYDQMLGKTPSISLMKYLFTQAALTVPGVSSAQVFITGITDRTISGQVQVTSAATGQVSAVPFTTSSLIGVG
jgi:hypothetical protein